MNLTLTYKSSKEKVFNETNVLWITLHRNKFMCEKFGGQISGK